MPIQMTTSKMPNVEDDPKVKHAREVDAIRQQCDVCALNRPKTPTKDCAIKHKLVIEDSKVAWKHKHLFINMGHCKMFKAK